MSGSVTPAAPAEDAPPRFANPSGFYRFGLGTFDCIVLSEGDCGPGFSGALAVGEPPEELAGLLREQARDPEAGRVNVSAFAAQRGGETVLIDSGFGIFTTPDGANRLGQVAPNLRAAGVAAEEVDLVIITHPHGDHVGGLCQPDGGLTYPNARYVMPRSEWSFWMESEPDLSSLAMPVEFQQGMKRQARTVLPVVQPRLELVEPGDEVFAGMRLVATPGHTHGMVGVEASDGAERMLVLADLFMSPIVSVKQPHWRSAMDLDPSTAADTKRRFLERLAESGELTFCTHFSWPPLGRVVRRGQEYEWVPEEWRWWS